VADTRLEEVSEQQGGGGVATRFNTTLTQVGVPIAIGKSPKSGTACSVWLTTLRDPAYYGAKLSVRVVMRGHAVEFDSITLTPARVAANQQLVQTFGNCAAEYWEAYIQLAATVPAKALQSFILAHGVENVEPVGGGSGGLSYTGTVTGPSAGATIGFDAPDLNTGSTYLVTVMMSIESSAVDTPGQTFSTEGVFAWKNVAGVVSLVPVLLSAPNTSSDPQLAASTTSVGAAGGQATVTFETPATLDPSTIVNVSILLTDIDDIAEP
jgi:hypothetical protein